MSRLPRPGPWLRLVAALEREHRLVRRLPQLTRQALALRELRQRIVAVLGSCQCCAGCGAGHPVPHGSWDGGFCCGASTEQLFTADELAALSLSGTRWFHLRPRSSGAGCIFRGPGGCGLSPAHRPNLCVRFLCHELERELAARGLLEPVDALCQQLVQQFEELASVLGPPRQERELRDLLGPPPRR